MGRNGKRLDQDHDGNFGEPLHDVFTCNFTIDTTGPRITRQSPAGDMAGTIQSIDVWFSEAIKTATLTLADITIIGPSGNITPTSVAANGYNCFRITLPAQTALGSYQVRVGPNVEDTVGNLMDQNRDGFQGQPADVYQATFNLVDVDLEVSSVAVGATQLWPNDTVHVSWNGANRTGTELKGSWSDAVYF